MNNMETLLIVLGIVGAVSVIVSVLLPLLKRKGVDVGAFIERTKDVLSTVDGVLEVVRPFMDEAQSIDTFDKITGIAHIGVGNAEQLYLLGEIQPEQRKEAAHSYIISAAQMLGVEITPEVDKLINGAMEYEVLQLGHKPKAQG